MSEMVCPGCGSSLQKNTLECVGVDELDFVPKSKGLKFGINIRIGSVSIGKNEVLHGVLTDSYHCEKCNKIYAVYDLERE
ncbi:MAG TPA: PF20097 family protein [Thermoclostridium sp.]|uniref:DUF6487 domain-containing protein n=1 Tax=uncultured firmicutes bacterium contig_31 TaxID=1643554 RepID=A0A141GNC9_9FIRM|nr:hypothetical protein [uncultured firmicutes bacterium contig_31]